MNLADILQALYPDADFINDIQLKNDGGGIYISHWNEQKYGTKPTEQSLLDQAPSLALQHAQKQIEKELRILIESKPPEKGYDSVTTLTSYTTSGNTQWKAEADAFIAWRDSVFAYAYQTMSDVQNGNTALPTIDEFLAAIPALVWP